MARHGRLIVVSGRACRCCRSQCCRLLMLLLLLLLRRHIWVLHVCHVLLLGKVHLMMLLGVLRMRRTAMAVALRG